MQTARAWKKAKRLEEPVIALWSPQGRDGPDIYCVSTDELLRGKPTRLTAPFTVYQWDKTRAKTSSKFISNVKAQRPTEDELYQWKEQAGPLKNYSPEHVLNTDRALREAHKHKHVTAYCFHNETMWSAYADGLIVMWLTNAAGFDTAFKQPLLGHTNKVNGMHVADKSLVSCSYDCTVRFWSIETGDAQRVFKFSDPIMTTLVDPTRDFLFTGSWDKSVKAIDLKTGEVDRSFIASTEAVLCMHLYDKWLFVSG